MEAALSAAMPGYVFTVTVEHPQRQDSEDIFIEPDGVFLDLEEFLQRIADTLASFVADRASRLD